MKKPAFQTLAILSLIFLFFPILSAQVRGNGDVVKQNRDVPAFTGISVSSGIDLIIKQADRQEVMWKESH